MDKKLVNPKNIAPPMGMYTHTVAVSAKKLLFISGQVSLDSQGKVVGSGDFKAQVEQVFKNLEANLQAFNLSFRNVVKMNYYITDMRYRPILNEVRKKFILDDFPASTLVQVIALAQPELMLEIEAVAALD